MWIAAIGDSMKRYIQIQISYWHNYVRDIIFWIPLIELRTGKSHMEISHEGEIFGKKFYFVKV